MQPCRSDLFAGKTLAEMTTEDVVAAANAEMHSSAERVHSLIAELENRINGAISILREIEWISGPHGRLCPSCFNEKSDGHADSCELAEFLQREGV